MKRMLFPENFRGLADNLYGQANAETMETPKTVTPSTRHRSPSLLSYPLLPSPSLFSDPPSPSFVFSSSFSSPFFAHRSFEVTT